MRGKITGKPYFSAHTRHIHMTLEIDPEGVDLNPLLDQELVIDMKKWHRRRSLDANAYLWVLITELAVAHHTSKDEIYEMMLRDYPVIQKDGNGNNVVITVKTEVNMLNVAGHWLPYQSNGKWTAYLLIKGSSEMNTKEFGRLLDGVISECKEEGIETLPPAELERMMKLHAKHNAEK